MEPTKNLNGVFLGIGEFSFCEGATSRAATKTLGFRDIGNIMAFTPEIENTTEEHEGSYRTGRRVDKVFNTKQKLEYLIRSDEWNANQIQMLLMANAPETDNAAGALTATAGETIPFTVSVPSVSNRWYDLYESSGARRTNLTAVVIASSPATAAVAEADDDTFTDAGHGLSNGDAIFLQAAEMPTGLTAGRIYYVRDAATDTFKIAETPAGDAVNFTSDGTSVTWLPALIEGTDFTVDLRLGRVQFLTERTGTVYPYLTAAAVTSSSDNYVRGVQPMQNPTFEGYGRLVLFDPEREDTPLLDHRDFSCTVRVERSGEVNGTSPAELTLRVTVTEDEGVAYYPEFLA
jgi:hypothetical protein